MPEWPDVGETTVTPTRPRGPLPHGAPQVTASGNYVGKSTSANWPHITVCTTVSAMAATQFVVAGHRRGQPRPGRPRVPRASRAGFA
jgi:hypothetical protein